jgi:hypothetical protein
LRHCVDTVAAVAQENIFCAACAMSDATCATGAKVVASHRRNAGANAEYFDFAAFRCA